MLLSADQFLSYRAKVKKYLGIGEKELDEQIDEILKEVPKEKDMSMVEGGNGFNFGASVPFKPSTPTPTLTEYTIKLLPFHCVIDPESELYQKLMDTIDFFIFRVVQDQPDVLDRLSNEATAMKIPANLAKVIKELLERELLTNVLSMKLEVFRDWQTYSEKLTIGIALNLDQHYIDNYIDIVSQQMIDQALKNLETPIEEEPGDLIEFDKNSITGALTGRQVPQKSAPFHFGNGFGAQTVGHQGSSGHASQIWNNFGGGSGGARGISVAVGQLRVSPVTYQTEVFDGTTWQLVHG